MLSQGEQPGLPRVFAALDECQTLQKLGQLVVLVTEGRKSLRVMYGIQGRSQIKALYGEEAEVLLSAPYTKFLMRTSEPEASKWLAETVGDVEIERTRESRPANIGDRAAHSYSTERVIQKLSRERVIKDCRIYGVLPSRQSPAENQPAGYAPA